MKTIVDANPAARLAKDLVAYVNTLEHAHIAVSGGSTPRALFKILASEYRRAARWDRVTIWQVDERTVPPTDSLSNWKMIQEELLSQIIELKSHRMEAERLSAADDYETLLRTHQIKLDLVLLGMGADGHTASLFPGTAGLEERDRLVVRNEIPQLTTHRVTMTFPFINAARERWFLVAGADKADAFNRVLQGELPAARVPDPAWYVDPAAIGQ